MTNPADIIQEYLVAVGFQVDNRTYAEAVNKFNVFEKQVTAFIAGLNSNEDFKKLNEKLKSVMEAADKGMKSLGAKVAKAFEGVTGGLSKFVDGVIASLGPEGLAIIGVVGGIGVVMAAIAALELAIAGMAAAAINNVAQVDQQVEIFAKRLWTTESNARSLKSVMDAMGIKSMDQLADINMNPELRKQFLELRETTRGLEPDKGQQEGFANIRSIGYEVQKFMVLLNYFMQNFVGALGRDLAGPLKDLHDALGGINSDFKDNLKVVAEALAGIVAVIIEILAVGFTLGAMIVRVTRFFADLGKSIGQLIVNMFGLGGKGSGSSIQEAADNTAGIFKLLQDIWNTISKFFEGLAKPFQQAGGAIASGAQGLAHGVAGAFNGISVSPHAVLSQNSRQFIDWLSQHVPGKWAVSSGMDGHHAGGPNSHASGAKFDFAQGGYLAASPQRIADLYKTSLNYPGFDHMGLELGHTKYLAVMDLLKRQHVNTSKLSDFSSAPHSGDNIDVRSHLVPMNVTINVNGAQSPSATAAEVNRELAKKALLVRSKQPAYGY